jgi:hypothetical protein
VQTCAHNGIKVSHCIGDDSKNGVVGTGETPEQWQVLGRVMPLAYFYRERETPALAKNKLMALLSREPAIAREFSRECEVLRIQYLQR